MHLFSPFPTDLLLWGYLSQKSPSILSSPNKLGATLKLAQIHLSPRFAILGIT